MLSAFLTGLGLAAPAGLNAYLPLLVLALADYIDDGETLTDTFDFISSVPFIVLLIILLTLELVVDKLPGADRINDGFQSVIRLGAGALGMMAVTADSDINMFAALATGLLVAGFVHAAKITTRRHLPPRYRQAITPLVSFVEDGVAIVTAIMALVLPSSVPVLLLIYVALMIWALRARRRYPGAPVGNSEARIA